MEILTKNIIPSTGITLTALLICTVTAAVLGCIVALTFMYKSKATHTFAFALALLPVAVQIVIMIVNGNVGTGIAVAGAFSLIRFRSAPGSAKEIAAIFVSMGVGLACGAGYVGIAGFFCVVCCALALLYSAIRFGEARGEVRTLKVFIPENLDYTDLLDDIFAEYTQKFELIQVKTSNMGSLYKLTYNVRMKPSVKEKDMLDKIRCRNGNLDVSIGRAEALPSDSSL